MIGYSDLQFDRGWREVGRCFVHGPYNDSELPALIASYGVHVVLFPNRLPESFSYTLSEVWAAGIPVIVPDEGALAERVSRHQGGWLLPARFSADQASSLLQRLFSPEGAASEKGNGRKRPKRLRATSAQEAKHCSPCWRPISRASRFARN